MNNKGSITVEAAVVTPIFLLIIITLSFSMSRYYTEEKVDYALVQIAQELATIGYIYEKSGVLGIKYEAKEVVEEAEIDEKINEIIKEGKDLTNAIVGEGEAYNNLVIAFNKLTSAKDFKGIIDGLVEIGKSFESDIAPLLGKGEDILTNVKDLIVNNKKELLIFGGGSIYNFVEKYLCILYIDTRLKMLIGDYSKLGIISDIDFNDSEFFYSDDSTSSDITHLIRIKANYIMELPITLTLNNEIKNQHEILLRAWTGS